MRKITAPPVSEKLHKALEKIDRPGEFCASGSVPATLPGLDVQGVGAISLPLTDGQFKKLKAHCEQAPYGKGEDTLVDTRVRCVWRLKPEHFSLNNPQWPTILAGIVGQVQTDLGLEKQKLEAHLYELLLYEPGGFFLPHRDGEKLDRMVATLVVVLPSIYEGGELIVRLEGREKKIDSARDSQFHINFAAFYADCEHEVKPLRSGHRVCLVYNLTLAKAKKPLGAPRRLQHVAKIAEILREWSAQEADPLKLAVTLKHRYTAKGLEWDVLKGVDRAVAEALAEAAPQADCEVYLAQVTLWESGGAAYEEPSRRRWGRGWDYDEEEDEDEDDEDDQYEGDHVMEELFDTSLTAEHWRSPDGTQPGYSEIPVERKEVVPPESLTAVKPEEELEGYTGNEGLTLERWYRHAAILLWPRQRDLDVLAQVGSRESVPVLVKMVSAWRAAGKSDAPALKERCLKFARRILSKWPETPYSPYNHGSFDRDREFKLVDPAAALLRLGEPKLFSTYLTHVLARDAALDPGHALTKAAAAYGWAAFRDEFASVMQPSSFASINRNTGLYEDLCIGAAAAKKGQQSDARETLRVAGEALLKGLEAMGAKRDDYEWRGDSEKRPAMLATFVRALLISEQNDLLARLTAHIEKLPKGYDLRQVQLPALRELDSWLRKNIKDRRPALLQWVANCASQLSAATAAEPRPPADFRRDAKVSCTCQDCAELKAFLRDPHQSQHGFQMAESRRRHLQSMIGGCDLDYMTDKKPRPQVLVCTKNTKSFERQLKQYHEDLKSLESIKTLDQRLSK